MKQFHIIEILPFDLVYDSVIKALIADDGVHIDLMQKITFDINSYSSKIVKDFMWDDQCLVLYFNDNTSFSVSLDSNNAIVINLVVKEQYPSTCRIDCIYSDGDRVCWIPSKSLNQFKNKRFKNVYYAGKHWLYIYFFDSEFTLIVNVSKTGEFPFSILHWSESL